MKVSRSEVQAFSERVEARYGLVFDEGRQDQLGQALLARCSELHLSGPEYLGHLEVTPREWDEVAGLLTVPESYFFRHADHLRAFCEVAVPKRVAAREHNHMLRVCCIGCASGEEPYTLSMLLLEHPELAHGWQFRIRACDINPEVLRRAERGTYTNWALRATPPVYRERYFSPVSNRFRIADAVRRTVHFDQCNVLDICRAESFETVDVVFFRNVLIYFSPEAIRAAVSAVAHMLAPGGYLFLGPAETLRGISEDFHLCHTHDTFYYRRKNSIGKLLEFRPVVGRPVPLNPSPPASVPRQQEPSIDWPLEANEPLPAEASSTTEWMDEIERSTQRIHGLDVARKAILPGLAAPREAAVAVTEVWPNLLAMFSAERYADILQKVADLPSAAAQDSDIQLLRALAHLNQQEARAAEAVCRSIIANDAMNANSHYVLALCREEQGDLPGSADHDRVAIYLDPSFAMPHMHLALIARRRGDTQMARREFERAILLLARENVSRLVMLGGGFGREALRRLCRRELQAIGAA